MTAVVLPRPGPSSSLEVQQLPVRDPAAGEVRVKVAACGVCHRDVIDREGKFPFMQQPTVLGHEIAGVVESVGEGVTGFSKGDRVVNLHWASCGECPACLDKRTTECIAAAMSFIALTIDGGYAEYCTAGQSAWVKVPDGWAPQEAATVMCTYGTVWRALRKANVRAGEKVLVTGASGGVGSAALQICKAMGLGTYAVTSAENKVDHIRAMGADEVVVVPREGTTKNAPMTFHKHPLLAKRPVDLVFEAVGEPTFKSALRSLRSGGRLVLVGNVSVGQVPLPLGSLIIGSKSIVGSDSCTGDELREVFAFLDEHGIRPVVSNTFPLEQAAQAQDALESLGVKGRTVLTVGQAGASNQWPQVE